MINTPEFRENLQSLSRNNVNNSSTFNGYLAILEGAEGVLAYREKINNTLISFIPEDNSLDNTSIFNSLGSIREKVAYISTLIPNENTNTIIENLYQKVLKNLDLSESAIIRISALNRFKIHLSSEQNIRLIQIEREIQELINENIPDLGIFFHLNNETPAQRIQKIKEICHYFTQNGVLERLPDRYGEIVGLLQPLHELDDHYHILNHARNNFYDIQRGYGEVQILSSEQRNTLEEGLKIITGNPTLITFYNTHIKNNLQDIDLESILHEILSNISDSEEKLKSIGISIGDFQRYFLYYFSTEILYKAKVDIDRKKKEVFKDKKRDFELDVKKYREIQRDRLLELCQTGTIREVENIFERDRKLFLRTGNIDHNVILQTGLERVLFERYPNTDRNIISQLAQAIMDENEVTNELYYGNTNYFQNDSQDTGGQNLVKTIGNAGRNIQEIGDFTTPIIGGFVKLTQKSLELGGKTISTVINGTTGNVKGIVDKYNTWANTPAKSFFGSVAKFPFKASQILTRPIGWGASGVHFITSKTTDVIGNSYHGINEAIKNASNQEIDNLFDIFTKTYKYSVHLLGQSTAWSGDKAFDMLKTQQKREILGEFYESKSHSEVSSLLEAIDMQSVLKDSSPYIFDDDYIDELGYKVVKQKEVVDNSSEEMKLLKSKIDEILEDLEQGRNQDEEIFGEIMKTFHQIKRELGKNTDEKNKFKAIKSKINTLIQTLKNILEDDENKSKILKKLGLLKTDGGDFEIHSNSILGHLQTLSISINKNGTIKKQKFIDAVLSLNV